MRFHRLHNLLLTACCLSTLPALAQRAAIAPIAPVAPRVHQVAPAIQGVDVESFPATRPAAPPQSAPYQWPVPGPDPLYILNSGIVIDNGLLNILPNDIQKLEVYKGGPDTPRKWRSLATYGIIAITLKAKSKARMKTRTLAEIGQELRLAGPVSYAINGMPVGEADLRIATVAIGEIQVTRPTATAPTTLVNIQIAHRTPKPPAPDPSGRPRIMIRGTAAL